MPALYPYTVTNSQKGGFFMRTYNRNVRRAWDGDDYHAPKRQRLEAPTSYASQAPYQPINENTMPYAVEDNLERAIRETSVAAMSSSPSRKNSTVFSLNEIHGVQDPNTLTPPSSPPRHLDITPTTTKTRKPTFSTLDKRKNKDKQSAKRKRDDDSEWGGSVGRDHSEPLSEIMNSSSRPAAGGNGSFQPVQPPAANRPTLPKVLTQTILDFGQAQSPITCTQCQMSYTPSVAEDVDLHNMYHNRHKDGIELSKPFLKSAMRWCYEVSHIPGSVVVVDRKISIPARRTVQKLLEVVNKELGSVEIPESELWNQITLEGEPEDARKSDHYKVFLHVIDGKCVALCLAERISKAFRVNSLSAALQANQVSPREQDAKEDSALLTPTSSGVPANSLASSADMEIDDTPRSAVVGVSRIWTSKNFRRKGIANNLLDCVVNQFIYGLEIDREEVAFSQPTDMGAVLAKNWYGEQTGWAVYREQ